MTLPYHTIMLAHHEGLSSQAIALAIHFADTGGMTARDLSEPSAHLVHLIHLNTEICDFLEIHRINCRMCSEFTRSERYFWSHACPTPPRAPDMIVEGEQWWKVRQGDLVRTQPTPYS